MKAEKPLDLATKVICLFGQKYIGKGDRGTRLQWTNGHVRTEEGAGGSSRVGRTQGHVKNKQRYQEESEFMVCKAMGVRWKRRNGHERTLGAPGHLPVDQHHRPPVPWAESMCRPSWFFCFSNLHVQFTRTSTLPLKHFPNLIFLPPLLPSQSKSASSLYSHNMAFKKKKRRRRKEKS